MKSAKHSKALQAAKESEAIFRFMNNKQSTTSGGTTEESTTQQNSTPASTSKTNSNNTRTLDPHIIKEKVEIRWVIMHLVSSHCSIRSSDNIGNLFRGMFSDSQIAQQFQVGRTKAGYLATFGLAPAIIDEINNTCKDLDFYTLLFDDSMTYEL